MLVALSLLMNSACARRAGSDAPPSAGEAPGRMVSVVRPTPSGDVTLTLPANVAACQTTLLYSRVNGYLLSWQADIGDRVQKGQVLAEIDTPELDQELAQARANLAEAQGEREVATAEWQEAQANLKQAEAEIVRAKANWEFARLALQRDEQLLAQRATSDQEVEGCRRDLDARRAELDAAEAQQKTRQAAVTTRATHIKSHEALVQSLAANVKRLEKTQAFKTIQAPFDGIVIRRLAEIGALVSAGSSASAEELFALAQADTLRVRINVPQSQALNIQPGQEARVLVSEYPNREFTAQVARTARALDPVSRTLMVELELANADYALLPGTFGQVRLTVRRVEPAWTVPANVLLSGARGQEVAVVDGQNMVRLRKVKLGRDYGSSVEVLSGLKGEETLVLNPPDDLGDNEQVTIANAEGGPGTAQGASVAQHAPGSRES
jgi:RND family efflux transporter MFP subunit